MWVVTVCVRVLQEKSGLWGALMVFIGLVGATIGGVVIDFTKLYKEVTVVVFSLALLFYIAFTMVRPGCVCVCACVHCGAC